MCASEKMQRLDTEHRDGIVYCIPDGDIDASRVEAIRGPIEAALIEGNHKFAINLEKVKFMDSGAMGMLVKLHKRIRAAKGKFVIYNVDDAIVSAMENTRLTGILTIAGVENEAVRLLKDE